MTTRKSDDGNDKPTLRRRTIKRAVKATQAPANDAPAKSAPKPKASKAVDKEKEKKKGKSTSVPEPQPTAPEKVGDEIDYADLSIAEIEALMTPKQVLFCLEFLKSFNATQAAIDAKYSKNSAQQIGAENLSKPVIRAYLAKAKEQVFAPKRVSAATVLEQIARLGFADVRKLFDEKGRLLPVTQLTDDIAAAVQSIEIETRSEGRGEEKELYTVTKLRLADKKGSLEMLGRHLQIFTREEDDEEAARDRKLDARLKSQFADLIEQANIATKSEAKKK